MIAALQNMDQYILFMQLFIILSKVWKRIDFVIMAALICI